MVEGHGEHDEGFVRQSERVWSAAPTVSAMTVRRGGSEVSSVPSIQGVAGSNPTLAAPLGSWVSPSLTVACVP